ncbi:4-hydroxybenzoate polyprenyltransferase [Thermosporothrix hazakensis]|jgi:4-hydroxybenzoate polyprenyltransferase|uniref:4-hydroxybenzoate polyprenyltransferase n=1 Tax=Thermosporothrix hazakensis TaxID=644383 RepID=A0A326U1F5_THEHA|nr:UbiA family prenyltransferase [Thermosporothrix hazakensis]PZW23884.1 4-hydroxybenzoate polyprenyltransferase [Thermosporothrix hazakensis]
MRTANQRHLHEVVAGFYQLCHPVPVLFHTIAIALFALLAAWPQVSWPRFVLVVAAHLAMQLSIAILNDYCDRELDARSDKKKPLVQGLVRPREALIVGLFLIVVMAFLLWPLNRLAGLLSLIYLCLGQGYNLGLKSTPLSGIVFALAMPLIPVYAFVGMDRFPPFIGWLIPLGALFGIALNLANSLPDIEEDRAGNARTLAVVLGVRGCAIAIPLLLLGGVVIIALLTFTHLVPANLLILLATFLPGLFGIGLLALLFRPQRLLNRKTTRRPYFLFVVCITLLLGGGWLAGVLF